MPELNSYIGFIGAGNMAEAIINGLLQSGVSRPEHLVASDVSTSRCTYMAERYGIQIAEDNVAIFNRCEVIVLAVKPQHMNEVLEGIAKDSNYAVMKRKIVISIAAGVPLQRLERYLYAPIDEQVRSQLPIVRVMPNTPALVRAGMAGMAGNRYAKKEDLKTVRTVLEAIGKVIEFDETSLDAVTALSGSGPAYIFYFVESLVTSGKSLGLTEPDSLILTLETIKGAVKLMEDTGESADLLRKKVTSPGGTTEAAFKVLEGNRVKEIIVEALQAAANRSVELSK
ncbi:MAG: pyrroline-5-carboxylate reductase [Pseudomonadota bacterium]